MVQAALKCGRARPSAAGSGGSELEESLTEVLARLAHLAEYRDDATGQHSRHVGLVASGIARDLGLPDDQVELIRWAAPLHDVGKIAIPDHILQKPGALTAEEFEIIKSHTTIGAKILSEGHSQVLHMAAEIALTHHERWDGTGYPQQLRGDAIPLSGRIVAVADAFEAMLRLRAFRKGRPIEQVVDEIQRCAGTQFDPRVVEAFLTRSSHPNSS
jgi:putative two-component system response regulator